MDLRRIKKLNEEMRRLINMSEISDELKQKVADTRKANYLAAQASLDKAKAKYKKNVEMNNKGKMINKNTITSAFKGILSNIRYDLDKDMEVVDELIIDGDVYKTIIEAPKLFEYEKFLYKNSEQALKDLLLEMSQKYGITYKYRILDGYRIEIYTEDINIDNRSVMEQILAGTYVEGNDYDEFSDAIVANLDSLTDEQLLFIFNTYRESMLCPSAWDYDKYGEYPAKLAKALSRSDSRENFSEYFNVFYCDHELSNGACDIFVQAFAKEGVDEYIELVYDTGGPSVQALAYIGCLSEEYPEICKKLLTQLVTKRPKAKEEFLEELDNPGDRDNYKFMYMMDTHFITEVLEAL